MSLSLNMLMQNYLEKEQSLHSEIDMVTLPTLHQLTLLLGRRLESVEELLRQEEGKLAKREEDDLEWGKGRVQKEEQVFLYFYMY